MPKTIQRTVAFYWLRLRSREAVSYRPVEDVDWESRLADLDSMKWQEKAIDGRRKPLMASDMTPSWGKNIPFSAYPNNSTQPSCNTSTARTNV